MEYVILTLGIAIICWVSGFVVGSTRKTTTGRLRPPQPWPKPKSRNIAPGKMCKGGINTPPITPRPKPPKAQT